jgi:hypothetical protein
MTEEKNYQVRVKQYKTGALMGQIIDNGEVIKEIWQDPILNPRVTLYLLRKQVEIMAWTDKL